MSQPTSAYVIKTVPEGVDPTQTDYTQGGTQNLAAGAGTLSGTLIGGPLRKALGPDDVEVQAQAIVEAEEPSADMTPWIVGGIALVGLAGVAFAFWPRD